MRPGLRRSDVTVNDAGSARAWLHAWGDRAFTLGRAERLVEEMRGCALATSRLYPAASADFSAAADVVQDAIDERASSRS